MKGLSVARIVNVTVSLAAIAAARRNFGAGLITGDSDVIDVAERIRSYNDISGVASDFASTSPEFLAAQKHFQQVPRPSLLYIGRWASTAVGGRLNAGILTPSQQLLSNFTAITDGAFYIVLDGKAGVVSGLNLSGVTNLNGVAALVQTAMQVIWSGSTCKWDAVYSRFVLRSGTTGATSTIGYGAAPTAFDFATFSGQPAANDVLTVNGTAVTFVASNPTGNQVLIGASLAATLQNLIALVNASADVNISKVSAFVTGSVVYFVSKVTGTEGNAYTLAKTSSAITVASASFTGGAGTSVATLLALTAAAGAGSPVAGVAAETPLACAVTLADYSTAWYSLQFASTVALSDADHFAVGQFIEAASPTRIYGITGTNTNVLDPAQSNDLCSVLKGLGLNRTYFQYSSQPYAAASFFGRAATVNFEGSNTAITMMFKREPGVTPETLPASQADALKAKNANVFVNYDNASAILEYGTMVSGYYFDEIHGTDWLQNRIQTGVYNRLVTLPKVPQTDPGSNIIVNEIDHSMQQAVRNGLVAPGVWNGPDVGQLKTGDYLDKGYYIFAPPYATQSQDDRVARKSVVSQVAMKLAGAVHEADVLMNVDR